MCYGWKRVGVLDVDVRVSRVTFRSPFSRVEPPVCECGTRSEVRIMAEDGSCKRVKSSLECARRSETEMNTISSIIHRTKQK